MKQLLQKLEKRHDTWFMLGCLVVFFLLRLPSIAEPYWYGDEGIYETVAKALTHGRMLYTGIWDNKPPLLYLTYALFNGEQNAVKFLSLVVGLFTIILFFALSRLIFAKRQGLIYSTTTIFTFLFATPIIEGNIANAENFMLLFIITAAIIVYQFSNHVRERNTSDWVTLLFQPKQLFWAGILLGIAFLYKVVAVFDFIGLGVFIAFSLSPETMSLKKFFTKKNILWMAKQLTSYITGFILPLLLTLIYYFIFGAGPAYISSIFSNNVGYVGYGNTLLIPQGWLIIKVLLLIAAVVWLYIRRTHFTKSVLFVLIWFVFETFDSFFSQRNYTHYMLMMLISFSLLIGTFWNLKNNRYQLLLTGISIVILLISINYFIGSRFIYLGSYYKNYVMYITNHKTVDAYRSYFDKHTLDTYLISDFLHTHTKPNDIIFVWGDSAQIYALSNTLPPGRFTVAYHVTASKSNQDETAHALAIHPPAYIILLSDAPHLSIPIGNYQPTFAVNNNIIYERSH